ncbi:MAG: peptide chain release factor 1 [Lentisphaerae bacterium GWF2_52_8]|nr:MAG: peptide chain release factor 1 [Lentisphaerae bacterium GWF2_52_8]
MTPSDIASHIDGLRTRFAELETKLSDPSIYSRPGESRRISQEHQKLASLFKTYGQWSSCLSELEENRVLSREEKDPELQEMARAEIPKLEEKAAALEKVVLLSLLPPDPNESRNTIIEIRPAAGGDEAGLFASELYRVYSKYAEQQGWKLEVLEQTGNDVGGIKEVVFSLIGNDVYARMKFESGVHRVQRVPSTEASGRIHTSTVTVAVLAEAEEVDIEIKPDELRYDVFRSSGPGGQYVNTTDSAVRVTHIPTGLSVASQQEKSQHRNREIALRILRSRLLEQKQQEELAKQVASKRAQIGTGDRSERIRTYNFPQNRVTDHRYGLTVHGLPRLLEGDLDMLLEQIISLDCERRLAALTAVPKN